MMHAALVTSIEGQYYWQCSCGDRRSELTPDRNLAQEEAEVHEYDGRRGKFRVPTPRPTMKTLVKSYREKQEQETYTPAEREAWRQLADEIEDQVALDKKPVHIEGQLGLFD